MNDKPERNAHVHPLLRKLLNDFADTQLADAQAADRRAELQAERLAEWRADDRESAKQERDDNEEARWPR